MARLHNILLAALGIFSLAYASPLAKRNFPNPVPVTGNFSNGHVHDPSVIQRSSDGEYFMVCLLRLVEISSQG